MNQCYCFTAILKVCLTDSTQNCIKNEVRLCPSQILSKIEGTDDIHKATFSLTQNQAYCYQHRLNYFVYRPSFIAFQHNPELKYYYVIINQ